MLSKTSLYKYSSTPIDSNNDNTKKELTYIINIFHSSNQIDETKLLEVLQYILHDRNHITSDEKFIRSDFFDQLFKVFYFYELSQELKDACFDVLMLLLQKECYIDELNLLNQYNIILDCLQNGSLEISYRCSKIISTIIKNQDIYDTLIEKYKLFLIIMDLFETKQEHIIELFVEIATSPYFTYSEYFSEAINTSMIIIESSNDYLIDSGFRICCSVLCYNQDYLLSTQIPDQIIEIAFNFTIKSEFTCSSIDFLLMLGQINDFYFIKIAQNPQTELLIHKFKPCYISFIVEFIPDSINSDLFLKINNYIIDGSVNDRRYIKSGITKLLETTINDPEFFISIIQQINFRIFLSTLEIATNSEDVYLNYSLLGIVARLIISDVEVIKAITLEAIDDDILEIIQDISDDPNNIANAIASQIINMIQT